MRARHPRPANAVKLLNRQLRGGAPAQPRVHIHFAARESHKRQLPRRPAVHPVFEFIALDDTGILAYRLTHGQPHLLTIQTLTHALLLDRLASGVVVNPDTYPYAAPVKEQMKLSGRPAKR